MEVFNTVYGTVVVINTLYFTTFIGSTNVYKTTFPIKVTTQTHERNLPSILFVGGTIKASYTLFVLRGSDVEAIKSSLQYPSNISGLR